MTDRLTIVGPEPDDDTIAKKLDKVNIEALMLMAKYDDDFRKLLIEDREKALSESGIKFSAMERMLLMKISAEKLSGNIDQFHIPGITGTSLGNWRKAAAVIMLATSVLFVAPNCQRSVTKSVEEQDKQGWIDMDTYRVIAIGNPSPKFKDVEKRKASAKHAAILNAQYQILETFKGAKIEGATGIMSDEYYYSLYNTQREIEDYVRGGQVIRETYDAEQNCEIMYEVRAKNLKKRVMNTEWN